MSDVSRVNSQVLDAIEAVAIATLPPADPHLAGLGKAVQSVAQSTAIAVQDATDNLRNSMTIATTAIGAAMAQLIASGDNQAYDQVVQTAQGIIDKAATQFRAIGTDAAEVLAGFKPRPSGKPGNGGGTPS